MKYTMTLVLILSASPMVFAARKTSNINYDSWAILYGRGKFEDGHKKTENISLQGESYKFVYSHRKSYFDTSAVLGLSNFSDNFTYSGIEGEIEHTKLTYGYT